MKETFINSDVVCKIMARNMIKDEMEEEFIIRTKKRYLDVCEKICRKYGAYEKAVGELCFEMPEKRMMISGYCDVCQEESQFELDYMFSELVGGFKKKSPVYRERLVCSKCKLNNRMRYLIGVMKRMYLSGKSAYMYEYVTQSYKEIKKFIPDLVGSEYLGDYESGSYIDGILHEDAMNLSFESEMFDFVLSQDVFEHVSDYDKAFREMFRVMKPDGKAVITVPFATFNDEVEKRAEIINGELVYHKEPMYHGNPLSKEGALVYNIFSWDLLDTLKAVGFKDVYIVAYYSILKANYGILPFYIIAEK
ncbi:class I SAM-dependent methyltransferase [Lacrimispora sp.]|uniref:class I SAM-dependent methyltransferase n=1 Tax=Lacrimispora sp. TaxID=2719234 RepID=UPI002FD8CE38